jgi:hypothetical protein
MAIALFGGAQNPAYRPSDAFIFPIVRPPRKERLAHPSRRPFGPPQDESEFVEKSDLILRSVQRTRLEGWPLAKAFAEVEPVVYRSLREMKKYLFHSPSREQNRRQALGRG